jgi:hypothetical protein
VRGRGTAPPGAAAPAAAPAPTGRPDGRAPWRRRRTAALAVFGFWTAVALLHVWIAFLNSALSGRELAWGTTLLRNLLVWHAWSLATLAIVAVTTRFPLARPSLGRSLLVHVALALALFAGLALFETGVRHFIAERPLTLAAAAQNFFRSGLVRLTFYALVVLAWQAYALRLAEEEEEEREERLRQDLLRARLDSLERHLQPRLLFHSLDRLHQEIAGDPRRAERILEPLAQLLRASLESAGSASATRQQGAGLLTSYFRLLAARYEAPFQVVADNEAAEGNGAIVSPLPVLPLFEAIARRHPQRLRRISRVRIDSGARGGAAPGLLVVAEGLELTAEELGRLFRDADLEPLPDALELGTTPEGWLSLLLPPARGGEAGALAPAAPGPPRQLSANRSELPPW